ncbi:putative quinol monooxygenase [Sporichthya sp.]|uniref:putative quinol monooxygenase n=1 Tax=Sporichthya sp. TaxID=65475 RepID=UPI001828AA8D|nr:antibiotic biosynthesis monooxygenase family protein [Sporichthya sp.]MBA3744842.1 antibiotic biosynthesis monooxygenase [Sporichthya sp.]
MLIIAGTLTVAAADRDAYVRDCVVAVEAARAHRGCLDFSVSADPVDPGRINVYERWDNEADLLTFRGSGPDQDQTGQILDADVKRYVISDIQDP